jgi:DNA topoisomerase-1
MEAVMMLRLGSFNLIPNPQAELDGCSTAIERIVAGALFDFGGMLTSMEKPVTLSGHHNAAPAADLIAEFAKKRGLRITNALVNEWQSQLAMRVASAVLTAGKERSKEEVEADAKRRTKKVNAIRTLAETITKLRHNLTRDLKSDDERTRMTALAISIMDKTAERVGNDESAQNGHFGVTGFKKKHVSVEGNKVHLKYIGKSGVDHDKTFSDKRIAEMVKACLDRCEDDNCFLLTCSDGYKVKADRVNRYLDEYGVTAKDIRGYSANQLMVDALKNKKVSTDEKERKKVFLETLRKVAEDVGHGPQMLRNSYLLPTLEPAWINDGKIVSLSEA